MKQIGNRVINRSYPGTPWEKGNQPGNNGSQAVPHRDIGEKIALFFMDLFYDGHKFK